MTEWVAKDLRFNWHPYTQMSDLEAEPPLLIERARGIKLFGPDGRWWYDTISSWWCNVHGHCHPRIAEAVCDQMGRLDHVLFAAVAHRPAVKLSERLVDLAPPGLEKVFYSDDGSTAVEVALKMSLQHWRNLGREAKNQFVCLNPGYHGDTIGCMSISGVEAFRRAFGALMFESHSVPAPYCYRCPLGLEEESCHLACLALMEEVLEEHQDRLAALIMEPLLLAAGGMITYPPEYLAGAARMARERGVHLILDEVATGFGRTGTMFACEQAGVCPDFLCLSKGITSGTLPFAATLVAGEVYESFLDEPGKDRTFYHGHTYTANPVGCAAALANLDLFEEEGTLEQVAEVAPILHAGVREMESLPHVGQVRCLGMVGALELVGTKEGREPLPKRDPLLRGIYREGLEAGVLLRPIGNVIYLMPPLCTTEEELSDILERMRATIERVLTD